MSSIYGEALKLSIFGQSHGPAIGMTLDGIPAGLKVDMQALQAFLDRRAPGKTPLATSRQEADTPEFLAGLVDSCTCGAPITAIIRNQDAHSSDYSQIRDIPRPGHADFTAQVKYGGHQDASGGGHFSGRLTAPVCIGGGLCLQWLEQKNIRVEARLVAVGKCEDSAAFASEIEKARSLGDSLGGVIECTVSHLPAGLGEPMFGGMENKIAQIIFGIPGVKGLEFGSGFAGSQCFGSENNDAFTVKNGKIETITNHSGGILGGITTGMPLVFRVAVKPTPSIVKAQNTIRFSTMEETVIQVTGRHDPCIALRAVPVVEAAAALAVMDAILCQKGDCYGA